MGMQIQILIADDHTLVRTSLAKVLAMEPDLSVVGEAIDGYHAIELVAYLQPDVVLMDVGMPRLNGVEATRRLRQSHPEIKVIGLSTYDGHVMAPPMLEAGAVAYIQKDAPMEKLIAAIRGCAGEASQAEV